MSFFALVTGLATASAVVLGSLIAASYAADRFMYPWSKEAPGVHRRTIERDGKIEKEFIADDNRRLWIRKQSCQDSIAFEQHYVYRDVPVQILLHVPCPPELAAARPRLQKWDWIMLQLMFWDVPTHDVIESSIHRETLTTRGTS